MMTRVVRIVAMCVAVALMAGCVEFLDLLEITAYEESDDPRVKKTGEVLREIEEDRQVRNALDKYVETGDPRFLEDARAVHPGDTGLAAPTATAADATRRRRRSKTKGSCFTKGAQ